VAPITLLAQPRIDIAGLAFTNDQVPGDWFPDDPGCN
jgi:hypothetical protein